MFFIPVKRYRAGVLPILSKDKKGVNSYTDFTLDLLPLFVESKSIDRNLITS